MNRLPFLSVLLCISSFATAQEQEKYQFPSGPATWVVTCVPKGSSPSSEQSSTKAGENSEPATVRQIQVSQTKDARRSVIHWSNGQTRELWSLPKLEVIVTEDPAGAAIVSRNTLLFGEPFSPSEFAWLRTTPRTSEKPVAYGEVQCYHYKGTMELPDPAGMGPAESIPCEAWIDAKTLLPVAFLRGDVLGQFTFTPLLGAVEMPEKFRKRLDYYKLIMGIQ